MSLQAQHVHHGRTKIDTTAAYRLSEVRVTGKTGVTHIRQSGYNAMTIDTKSMQNTTKTLADALRAAPGIKLRETGGVGGQTNIMLDGMDAKYVKVFIDGVPQEGVGSAYRLSNIPVGMADHIEVYKGVVPVEFGSDAMGGVINIVTRRRPFQWYADASYSYGSFNTHRTTVRFGQNLKRGWMYDVSSIRIILTTTTRSRPSSRSFSTTDLSRPTATRLRRCAASMAAITTRRPPLSSG